METHDILRFVSALILVVSLMGILWIILKRLNISGGIILPQGKKRRLMIVETLPLDMKHKAILLRRDATDHLVILGPNGETVVESSIPVTPVQEDTHDA